MTRAHCPGCSTMALSNSSCAETLMIVIRCHSRLVPPSRGQESPCRGLLKFLAVFQDQHPILHRRLWRHFPMAVGIGRHEPQRDLLETRSRVRPHVLSGARIEKVGLVRCTGFDCNLLAALYLDSLKVVVETIPRKIINRYRLGNARGKGKSYRASLRRRRRTGLKQPPRISLKEFPSYSHVLRAWVDRQS